MTIYLTSGPVHSKIPSSVAPLCEMGRHDLFDSLDYCGLDYCGLVVFLV